MLRSNLGLYRISHIPSKRGFRCTAYAVLLATLCVAIAGCRDITAVDVDHQGLNGRITLEGQPEHSGIMLDIEDSALSTATDSTGYFAFEDVPDGDWTLVARYPYFAPCTLDVALRDGYLRRPIDVTLPQLMRFWVDPESVVVSLGELDGPIEFDLHGYAENVSDQVVMVGGVFDPARMVAFRRVGSGESDICVAEYGQLMSWTLPRSFGYYYEPGDIGRYGLTTSLPRSCHPEGTYLIYWALSDEATYPEWLRFGAPYNESLYTKEGLFQIGRLIITS
jgi:hypothetical protein